MNACDRWVPYASSLSSAFASHRSSVSKPSVNQSRPAQPPASALALLPARGADRGGAVHVGPADRAPLRSPRGRPPRRRWVGCGPRGASRRRAVTPRTRANRSPLRRSTPLPCGGPALSRAVPMPAALGDQRPPHRSVIPGLGGLVVHEALPHLADAFVPSLPQHPCTNRARCAPPPSTAEAVLARAIVASAK